MMTTTIIKMKMKMKENSIRNRRKRRKVASATTLKRTNIQLFMLATRQQSLLLFVIALTCLLANQICDIQSTPIQLHQHQHQQQQQIGSSTSNDLSAETSVLSMPLVDQQAVKKDQQGVGTSYPSSTSSTSTSIATSKKQKPPKQKFRHKPEPIVTLTEGNTILLRCEVDNQQGDTQWLKDGGFVFYANRKPAHDLNSDRRNIVGSVEKGEHNLELVNAQLDDSGEYECQVLPSSAIEHDELRATVQVIVRPQQQIIEQVTTTTTNNNNNDNKQQHSRMANLPANSGDSISLTKLPRGATVATGSSSSSSSSATGIVAAASSISPSSSASSTAQFLTHHQHQQQHSSNNSARTSPILFLLSWPYVLLCLAGILMLANIYIIYSLLKRHQENQRANSKCSLGSSTVTSSGSPLVSSSQSTESSATTTTGTTTTAATTTTTTLTDIQQQQQQQQHLEQQQREQQHKQLLQFQLHQQQLQLQLQQQLHQLRPPISASCDYEYDYTGSQEQQQQQLRIRPDSSLRI